MANAEDLDLRLLKQRKLLVTGVVVLTILVLIGLNFGSWIFLQKIGDFLEEELGQRLRAVAVLTTRTLSDYASYIESGQVDLVLPSLTEIIKQIHRENQLQGVFLVDEMYQVLASSQEVFHAGDKLTFLEEDSESFLQALAGFPAVSPMLIIEGHRFKSAYAPVMDPLGKEVVAVLVIQASADFFNLLRVYKRGLIVLGIGSLGVAVVFSLVLFWAISLLMKTHESLRRAERLAAMGQMAATVAHEIRNPLGIIKSTADVLKSKYDSRDNPDELFEFIPSEVRRLNRLVSDFLTFARDRDLEPNAIDLLSTIGKSLNSLEDEIQQSHVQLIKELEPLPPVSHDEDALNQVLLNLVLNAIQSMNDNGKLWVRARPETRRGKTFVRVEVEDTGCGFEDPPEKIFEPFYTTKTSGSGLGLAICKRIIEKHGGWIEAKSEKGKGTIMRFYLPASNN